jgi:hypothetical protein
MLEAVEQRDAGGGACVAHVAGVVRVSQPRHWHHHHHIQADVGDDARERRCNLIRAPSVTFDYFSLSRSVRARRRRNTHREEPIAGRLR